MKAYKRPSWCELQMVGNPSNYSKLSMHENFLVHYKSGKGRQDSIPFQSKKK